MAGSIDLPAQRDGSPDVAPSVLEASSAGFPWAATASVAFAGLVLGAVIGYQIGFGRGRDAVIAEVVNSVAQPAPASITPALEKRLANSVVVGHSGELRVGFYKDGFRMVFENGRIALIEAIKHNTDRDIDVAFPELTFLHILFGHRSLDELRHACVDCYVHTPTARVLLNALFPKRDSFVYPIA